MAKKIASVIVIFRNEERYLGQCIESILNQSYKDFELILVNDASSDKSKQIALSFKDSRIFYYENTRHSGHAATRNLGLAKAEGKYIVFTDADCIVNKNWIEEALRYLTKDFIGVQGRTFYIKKDPTISDKTLQQLEGGAWGTSNMAYRADILRKLGGFNSKFDMAEDRDVALRARRYGRLSFNKNMIAYHQIKKWSPRGVIQFHIRHAKLLVYLRKYCGDRNGVRFRCVAQPRHLAMILCPFLFPIASAVRGRKRIRNWHDVKIAFCFYIAFILERIYIWKTAIEEGIFLV